MSTRQNALEVLDPGRDGHADENWNRASWLPGTKSSAAAGPKGGSTMNIRATMVNAHSRKFLGVPCNRPRRHSFYLG
jgi:hypothetical protein